MSARYYVRNVKGTTCAREVIADSFQLFNHVPLGPPYHTEALMGHGDKIQSHIYDCILTRIWKLGLHQVETIHSKRYSVYQRDVLIYYRAGALQKQRLNHVLLSGVDWEAIVPQAHVQWIINLGFWWGYLQNFLYNCRPTAILPTFSKILEKATWFLRIFYTKFNTDVEKDMQQIMLL